MDPLLSPPVTRARASLAAAESALSDAKKAYYAAVFDAFPSREDAFSALDLTPRTGYRLLRELGLSRPR